MLICDISLATIIIISSAGDIHASLLYGLWPDPAQILIKGLSYIISQFLVEQETERRINKRFLSVYIIHILSRFVNYPWVVPRA